MQTKQPLTVLGTLIFLVGVFGYIFPVWQTTRFTNNENLLHVVLGVVLLISASLSQQKRHMILILSALLLLALGLAGFSLKDPNYFVNNRLVIRFDEVDNYLHCLFALALGWAWVNRRKSH